ncbi:MAG: hypothetical protein HRT35_32525 [Algicola sp.]|nr:hypothetical protein [Algicola sp.]
MTDIKQLLEQVKTSQDKALGESIYQLQRWVKQHEGESCLSSVANAMPWLADCLITGHQWNVDGCAISIFRRVTVNKETLERLIALNKEKIDWLLVEAMSKIEVELFSDAVEHEWCRALLCNEAQDKAADALYLFKSHLKQPTTIIALGQVALTANSTVRDRALQVLCHATTTHSMNKLAMQQLLLIEAQANQAVRQTLKAISNTMLSRLNKKILFKDKDGKS